MDTNDRGAEAFARIDAAFAAGWSGLRAWYYDVPASVGRRLRALCVVVPSDQRTALRLEIDGRGVADLQARLGRGNNSDVYLTGDERVLKLARTPRSAHKLLLKAWVRPHHVAHGIRCAEVTELDPDGLYLVQERVGGPTVRDAIRHYSALTRELRDRFIEEASRLRAFGESTGLWIDLRARDVFVRRDGALVHVDYGPRVYSQGDTSYSHLDDAGERHFYDDDTAITRFLDSTPPSAMSPT